ncbi:hypothetical protein, partial [Cronobacter sakazakii]|uniref:hypothetical protein n=1 Tax=Cronobacter sakazakii TaxID=28141 RepID=UPI001C9D888D
LYLSENLQRGDNCIPSALRIWKKCFLIPFVCFVINLIGIVCFYLRSEKGEGLSFNGFYDFMTDGGMYPAIGTLIVGLFVGLLSFQYVLAYEVFHEEVKRQSILMRKARKGSQKFILALISLCVLSSLIGIFNPVFLLGTPVCMFVFIFIMNIVAGTELARYGAAPLLEKVSSLAKKI